MPKKYLLHLSFLLASLLLVWGIWDIPLIHWDESIYSTNAIEMLHNGNWGIHFFGGEIDWYNMKPVLFTWFRAMSFKFFGYELWVHRLPSVLFALASLALLICFFRKIRLSYKSQALALLLLATAPAFNTLHVSKGGEFDSALSFALGAFVFSSIMAFNTNAMKYKLGAAISLLLAFFVKSIAAFFFLPGLLIVLIIFKREWFKLKENYFLLLGVISLIGGYFLIMNMAYPGYWEHFLSHQFYRFANSQNDFPQPWYFYIKSASVLPYLLILIAAYVLFFLKKLKLSFTVHYLSFFCVSFLLFISCSSTKHGFYTAPLFIPFTALLVLIFKGLFDQLKLFQSNILRVLGVFTLIFALHFTYAKANYYHRYYDRAYPLVYLKQLLTGNLLMYPDDHDKKLGDDKRIHFGEAKDWVSPSSTLIIDAKYPFIPNTKNYNAHLAFYAKYWELEKDVDVNFMDSKGMQTSHYLLSTDTLSTDYLSNYTLIKTNEYCQLYQFKE